MARAKTVHVVWQKNVHGWHVKLGGRKLTETDAGYTYKEHAVERGRREARERKCELVIHNKNGKIGRKHSYGNDPRSSKG